MHRTKSIVAALAAIALSETAVFAAGGLKSPPSDHSWPDASRCRFREDRPGARGWPRRDRRGHPPEATETPEANETPEATESPDADATTGATNPHPDNHGTAVSEAAQGATPSGFANHGAYVSSIARANHGHGMPSVTPPVTAHVPTHTPTPTPTPTHWPARSGRRPAAPTVIKAGSRRMSAGFLASGRGGSGLPRSDPGVTRGGPVPGQR